MTIQPGEIWIADIRFTTGQLSKKRPVLVLWLDGADAIVAAITTAESRSAYDVQLHDWSGSGLRKPSTVRLARLDCLEKSVLIAKIGNISPGDGKLNKHTWMQQIKPQF